MSFNFADFSASSIDFALMSLTITFSVLFISFAILIPRAPTPARLSRKIFWPLKFFKNDEDAMTERSLFNFALGLKKAGSLGGALTFSEFSGTRSLVEPSVISTILVS